jgi:NAD(P)-dependent dehydrogenase (short-subunit alcohol dehydrogenase family)
VHIPKQTESQHTQRRALVTGGASGIGYAVANALLTSGAWVAIADIETSLLVQATNSLASKRLLPINIDVTSQTSVRAGVEVAAGEFGGLDTLVNCAGVIDFSPLSEITESTWDRVVDIDLKGVFLCCQAAAPFLCSGEHGRIVSISSDAGKKGYPLISSYCAAKFGVIGFSKAIAGELAPHGVTVNCICPIGVASTGMGQKVLQWLEERTGRSRDEILASRERGTPLGRMATMDDVVHAVMFFLSDKASFLTGQALNVDGGLLSTGLIAGLE